jgi:Putative flagellar system-associated repeat
VHPTITGADQITDGLEIVLDATLDNTPPALMSAATDTGGVQLSIGFDEAMGTGTSGFTVKINGEAASVLSYSWNGLHTILTLTMGRGITSADTVTLDYAPGTLSDFAGNALAAITGQAVVNNSTVSGGGESEVALYIPPFRAAQGECGCAGTITLTRGDVLPALRWLVDSRWANVPVTLAQLSARLIDSAGSELVPDLTVAVESEILGLVVVTIDTTEAALDAVTSCTLEITKTASSTNIAIFTAPIRIEG